MLVIRSRVFEINEKIIKFMHVMYSVETLLEATNTRLVGLQLDTKIRKAFPVPANVIKKCKEIFNIKKTRSDGESSTQGVIIGSSIVRIVSDTPAGISFLLCPTITLGQLRL